MSRFDFIDKKTLRNNLDLTLDHIIDLLSLSESESYKNTPLLVSSFRKTIIIHTASIIEALLLWKLGKKVDGNKVVLSDEWKYYDITTLHDLADKKEIIAGKRKREKKKVDRLDFLRVIDQCVKKEIVKEELSDDLHKVRELRNRLHIGGLSKTEKKYTHNDLTFVFGIANKVKSLVAK